MTIYEFFSMMGGVGLFLYGMSIMSTGLKNAAGDKLRGILEHATSNRFVAVIVGILVTLLIQSSSATDMMVISFVNSGLMSLAQAIGVIMGANIGTTVTAQITAFNLGAYAPIILFVGAIMYLFLKRNTVKYVGSIIMGFGMLFMGISIIKDAIKPLSQSQPFIDFLENLQNPAVAIIFGVLFTALLQSSSSSVVIFQTFAIQGLIGFNIAVYLVIGAAIGSVAPNLLASLTTNRNGKRTAVLNLLFNLIRATIIVVFINICPQFLTFIQNLSPDSVGHQVANAHTFFAVIAVLVELPMAAFIVFLSQKIIPLRADENKKIEDRKFHYIVPSDSVPSSVTLHQAFLEVTRMSKLVEENLYNAMEAFYSLDEKIIQNVMDTEESVDVLTESLSEYLVSLRSKEFSAKDFSKISQLILIVSDLERISDHAENIVEYALDLKNHKAVISPVGMENIKKLADATLDSVTICMQIFETSDEKLLPEAEKLEQVVDDIKEEIELAHIQRLMEVTCDPAGGIIFTDISIDLERSSDHALNIATALFK